MNLPVIRAVLAKVQRSDALIVLVLFLASDAAVVLIEWHFRRATPGIGDMRLATDRAYGEVVQYLKYSWGWILLIMAAVSRRGQVLVVLALAFVYLLLDDFLGIHERVGLRLENWLDLGPVLGLRGQDIGEMIVSATSGAIILVAGALTYPFSDAASRQHARLTLLGLVLLAVFGVGGDAIHQIFSGSRVDFVLEVRRMEVKW